MIRLSLASLLCFTLCLTLCGQTADRTEQPSTIDISRVTEILVPVTVHDRDGNIVNGIQAREFHLTDNTKDQDITADVTYHPISLAIAIQANAAVEAILPQVRRIGPMLESMIVGDQGEACVLAFDHRLQLKQDFTNDISKISEALKKINPGSSTSRVRDAMGEGIRLLGNRPKERRRVLLIISETRDYGSEGKMRDVVLAAQFQNVIVYTVNMSRMFATLTNKPYPEPGGMASLPPAAQSMPSNVPATPNTIMQKGVTPGSAADAVPLIIEVMRDVKAIF